MSIKNKQSGFTLIEMIIYIALFSIIMGGLVVTSYQLSQNAGKTSSKVVTQEEINFVLKKIDWALTGASSSGVVVIVSPPELRFTNTNFSITPISIKLNATNDIEMAINGAANILTTKNVKVESLVFSPYNSNTKIISASFKIDGITTTLTKYLR